ncbi:sensor histidine kinase [Solirubrobacter soli]|uniref:sensor histidine kinase n=1 Tax=Solirubrobacter soli TaxID=363832 RepID=UPI00041657C3|nr:histidine kinase [Solirubrobacter soli]
MEGTEAGLRLMRRVTQWTLIGVAALAILLPAGDLVTRDLPLPALAGLAAGLAFVGVVEWRLMLAGMAGFEGVTPPVWRVGAAAAVGLVLWGAAGADDPAHWMWALPFASVVAGFAFTVPSRRRYLVVAGGIAASFVVGFAASGNPWAGVSGALWVFTCALTCVAQVWIWDVTLRLDRARKAEGEVAVLRERLRFAGDLHDIQGHQLQAIALKAQLAARLIGVDDDLARRHANDAHALALEALEETRELVQGYRRVGLATELANAVGILKAAGVAAAVEGTPEAVPVALQPLFGSLVREGATNLLRHTVAERCEIAVEREGDDVVVRMADDGVARAPSDGDGSGVAGLRERFAAVGGRVDAAPLAAGGFVLTGRAPHRIA